jgi:hypothetical protein
MEVTPRVVIRDHKLKDLIKTLEKLKFYNHKTFTFDEELFLIILLEPNRIDDNEIAWFSGCSTAIAGIDIYILRTLTREQKIRILFHEVVESYLQRKGYVSKKSHVRAVRIERKYFGNITRKDFLKPILQSLACRNLPHRSE